MLGRWRLQKPLSSAALHARARKGWLAVLYSQNFCCSPGMSPTGKQLGAGLVLRASVMKASVMRGMDKHLSMWRKTKAPARRHDKSHGKVKQPGCLRTTGCERAIAEETIAVTGTSVLLRSTCRFPAALSLGLLKLFIGASSFTLAW